MARTATINQHRLTGGLGREDFLFPGIDLDFFAGALFKASDDFRPHASVSVAVCYLGLGLTWRYGDAARRECDSIAAASESE
jgi:hypothetical protein